jgi:hypothetical protein
VSEYQYYEFRTIDRTLAEAEVDAMRSISSRAKITSTSFTNHYEWGDLKADPFRLLERYFDAFVYVIAAPYLLGSLSDHLGLHAAFTIEPVLIGICTLLLLAGLRLPRPSGEDMG